MINTVQILSGSTSKSSRVSRSAAAALSKEFKIVSDNPDLYVVVGGDGTLLHYLQKLGYPSVPFLGINTGSLGYFQEISPDELPATVKQMAAGRFKIQNLPLLDLRSSGKRITYSFNEFAIERSSARAVNLRISLDGFKFEKFIGDGLIISSPQGSTAYSGAAGGAILPYDLPVFEVVPNNPHQSALYKAMRQPLVLSSKSRIHIEVLEPKSRPARIVADGININAGTSFDMGISERNVAMLRTHKFNFYKRLSSKLIG